MSKDKISKSERKRVEKERLKKCGFRAKCIEDIVNIHSKHKPLGKKARNRLEKECTEKLKASAETLKRLEKDMPSLAEYIKKQEREEQIQRIRKNYPRRKKGTEKDILKPAEIHQFPEDCNLEVRNKFPIRLESEPVCEKEDEKIPVKEHPVNKYKLYR